MNKENRKYIEEIDILRKIAFLTSDIELAKVNKSFAVDMEIDIQDCEKKRNQLLSDWEHF